MSESVANDSSWFKPWWKALLVVSFFPFVLSYIILKQKWRIPVKVGIVAVFWILLLGIGAANSEETSVPNTQNIPAEATPTPTPEPEITLEQKQEDFKKLYTEYQKVGQGIVIIQTGMAGMSKSATSKEELYLFLDKVSGMQSQVTTNSFKLKVPNSLKDNSQLTSAISDISSAATHYKISIDKFKKYLDKDDFKALSEAKNTASVAAATLEQSLDKMEAVAKELNVDLKQIKTKE